VEATSYPGEISNDCDDPLVSIQAGHQMEIQAGTNITIPKLEIKANGRLTVKSGGKIIIEDKLNLDMQSGAAIVVE
jgi:CRISPR/Cas system CMR subunit Cmr6 (Cas7 group RAMP superfamily)